jgi:hypothetical protein
VNEGALCVAAAERVFILKLHAAKSRGRGCADDVRRARTSLSMKSVLGKTISCAHKIISLGRRACVYVCARVVLLKYNDGNYVVGTVELYISKRGKYQLRVSAGARVCVRM